MDVCCVPHVSRIKSPWSTHKPVRQERNIWRRTQYLPSVYRAWPSWVSLAFTPSYSKERRVSSIFWVYIDMPIMNAKKAFQHMHILYNSELFTFNFYRGNWHDWWIGDQVCMVLDVRIRCLLGTVSLGQGDESLQVTSLKKVVGIYITGIYKKRRL